MAESVGVDKPEKGWLGRLRSGLRKTQKGMAEGFGNLLLGEKEVSAEALEQLEDALLIADVGVDATNVVIQSLTAKVKRRELNDTSALFRALHDELVALLGGAASAPFRVDIEKPPFTILFVGVNGAGKTTTIGKLGGLLKKQGHSVLLASGDTFRAAASEQLREWGDRIGAPVIAQDRGADSGAVIYDAMQAAQARRIDIVLADTAGRLQNKKGLMDELAKVRRVMARFGNGAPHQTLLTLDAGSGQNGARQIDEFKAAAGVSGLVLTKLDGTARGGFVIAAAHRAALPLYFIGVGEREDDLKPFVAEEFVEALLDLEPAEAGAS